MAVWPIKKKYLRDRRTGKIKKTSCNIFSKSILNMRDTNDTLTSQQPNCTSLIQIQLLYHPVVRIQLYNRAHKLPTCTKHKENRRISAH